MRPFQFLKNSPFVLLLVLSLSNPTQAQNLGPYCGDGYMAGAEQCDDGNFINRDGCSAYCALEDLTPPTVLSASITDGAENISNLTDRITVNFSELMDEASLNLHNVKLKEYNVELPIEIQVSENKTQMTVVFLEPLQGEKTYSLIITNTKDAVGNQNSGLFVVSFKTGEFIDVIPPNTVAKPAGGEFHVGQAVKLGAYLGEYTGSDEFLDPGAKIYYTLDGSTPTTHSLQYTVPISIRNNTTLKFFGVDTTGNKTDVISHEFRFSCPELPNAKEATDYPQCQVLECNYGFILSGNVCVIRLGDPLTDDYKAYAVTAPLFGSDTPMIISTRPALYISPEHQGTIPRPIHFKDITAGTSIYMERDTHIARTDGSPFTGYIIPPKNLYTKSFPINFGYSFKAIFHLEPAEGDDLRFDPMIRITLPITDRYNAGQPVTVFTFDPYVEEYFVHDPTLVTVNEAEGVVNILSDRTGTFFVAQPGESFNAIVFKDTINHWAKNYIEMLYRLGYVKGRSKGVFAPDELLSRAEFTKIALNAIGEEVDPFEEVEDSPFFDVPLYAWYSPYVKRAKEIGLIKGYPDASFKPDEPINRVEAIEILMRGFQFDLSSTGEKTDMFTDLLTSEWYFSSTNFAIQHRLIDGIRLPNGTIEYETFGPARKMTRAEMAKLAIKAIELKNGN